MKTQFRKMAKQMGFNGTGAISMIGMQIGIDDQIPIEQYTIGGGVRQRDPANRGPEDKGTDYKIVSAAKALTAWHHKMSNHLVPKSDALRGQLVGDAFAGAVYFEIEHMGYAIGISGGTPQNDLTIAFEMMRMFKDGS